MKAINSLSLILIIMFFSGCASMGPTETPQFVPIKTGAEVQLNIEIEGIDNPEVVDTSDLLLAGTGAGAAVGVSVAVQNSILCGPYILICIPILMVPSAAIGAVGGGIVGGIEGARISLPSDKAEALEQLVSDYLTAEDLAQQMRIGFAYENKDRWILVDESTHTKVRLGIQSLKFQQFSDDHLLISMTANMIVTQGSVEPTNPRKILFTMKTEEHHVDYWIANEGYNLKHELDWVLAQNAQHMAAILREGYSVRY